MRKGVGGEKEIQKEKRKGRKERKKKDKVV